jgi:hypothetical protein
MAEEKKYTYAFRKQGTNNPYKIPFHDFGVPSFRTIEAAQSDANMFLGAEAKSSEVIVLDIEHLLEAHVIRTFGN